MPDQVDGHAPLGRFVPWDSDPLDVVQVWLLAVPLKVWQRAEEHHDELMREMALLALDPSSAHDLPRRLLELVDVLGRQYSASSERPDGDRTAAIARGQDRVDFVCEISRTAGAAAAKFGALLEEAEDYCLRGDLLLTLGWGEVERSFARWYLDQFVNQAAGQEPVAWSGPWD